MRTYLENRIAELTKQYETLNQEFPKANEDRQKDITEEMEFIDGANTEAAKLLEHWNKQLQITDAEVAAIIYIDDNNGLKDIRLDSPNDAFVQNLVKAYVNGWEAKTIQLASMSEEQIDAISDEKFPVVEDSDTNKIYESYREGLIDMLNKIKS